MTDSSANPLDLELLKKLVDRDAVAIRGKATLEPAGGPGDKVFPPTHSVDKRERRDGAKYALEERRLPDGQVESCVLLDSVQSQANRMEEALQTLWADKKIAVPVIEVDFTTVAPDVGKVTSLSAPHRVADAIFRDSMLGEEFFRFSELGRKFTDATPRNATPLFHVCPTALVFGLWDSTGPRGGLGSKFARALVSEIVGVGRALGVKTASRIDPLGIVRDAGPIFVEKLQPGADGQPTWTPDVLAAEPLDPADPPASTADTEKARKWGSEEKAGKPSSINHGNVAPSIDKLAGGVTIDHAEHVVVLSLAGLRKLSFAAGEKDLEKRAEADLAARTTLAALGLLAVLAAEDRGHDLRSRCLLVPRKGHALKLEAVKPDGDTQPLGIDLGGAKALFDAAANALPATLRWNGSDGKPLERGKPLATLKPSEKLLHLVKKSRALAAAGEDIEEA